MKTKINKAKITAWNLVIYIQGKKKGITIADIDDDVAQTIDDFLTNYEKTLCPKCGEEMNEPDLDDLEEGATPYWYCANCKKNIRKFEEK